MYIDILIVNYFSAAQTVQAIRSLGHDPLWSFWVIDNSNDPREWQELQQALPSLSSSNLHLEKASSNLGFGRACNRLFEKSHAPYVLLLNPDARFEGAQLKTLMQALDDDPTIAALAPSMFQSHDRQWAIPRMTPQSIGQLMLEALIRLHPAIYRMFWQRYYKTEQTIWCTPHLISQDYLSGAILLLRRSAVQKASTSEGPLFDERYFMFFEDADLSRRLRKQGFQLAIYPQVIGFHYYQHHHSKNVLMQTSHALYEQQHFPWLKKIRRLGLFLHHRPHWIHSLYSHSIIPISLEQLDQLLGDRQLIAWSPSPFVMPAFWRSPLQHENPSFTAVDWDLLAPGQYFAIACQPMQNQTLPKLTWLRFQR